MSKRWDILGIGAAAVDDLLYVESFPRPDTKMPIKDRRRQGGGLTATALVAAARLGAKPAYCGRLGEDELSLFTMLELEREGVDCAPVQRVPGARPIHSIIIVDQSCGSRTILFSADGFEEPDPEQITENLLLACKVLFIDYFVPQSGIQAARLARAHGIPVVADIELMAISDLDEFISYVDHLIIGKALGTQLTGKSNLDEIVSALAYQDRVCTVVTAGGEGCWYAEKQGPVCHYPAFQVKVVDTTGCGDVFHGAYAAALALGEDISRAITIATAAAGLKATQPGGRAGIPNLSTVESFLKQRHA